MKELVALILVRLYYRLFVRPRPAAKAAPEWDIDLPGMKVIYRGPVQTQGHTPADFIIIDAGSGFLYDDTGTFNG
jgi:hypothetical protein